MEILDVISMPSEIPSLKLVWDWALHLDENWTLELGLPLYALPSSVMDRCMSLLWTEDAKNTPLSMCRSFGIHLLRILWLATSSIRCFSLSSSCVLVESCHQKCHMLNHSLNLLQSTKCTHSEENSKISELFQMKLRIQKVKPALSQPWYARYNRRLQHKYSVAKDTHQCQSASLWEAAACCM